MRVTEKAGQCLCKLGRKASRQKASRASEIVRAAATERINWGRGGVFLSGAEDQHLCENLPPGPPFTSLKE